jgi:hypothetical protein
MDPESQPMDEYEAALGGDKSYKPPNLFGFPELRRYLNAAGGSGVAKPKLHPYYLVEPEELRTIDEFLDREAKARIQAEKAGGLRDPSELDWPDKAVFWPQFLNWCIWKAGPAVVASEIDRKVIMVSRSITLFTRQPD